MNARTRVIEALEALDLAYWITGSDAMSLTGYARTTVGTDVVVDVTEAVYEGGSMGQASAGTTWVDLILPAPGPWTSACRERRLRVHDPVIGADTWVISPEDLVLAKLGWAGGGSARQREDAARILASGSLDLAYCRRMAAVLGVGAVLERILGAADAG